LVECALHMFIGCLGTVNSRTQKLNAARHQIAARPHESPFAPTSPPGRWPPRPGRPDRRRQIRLHVPLPGPAHARHPDPGDRGPGARARPGLARPRRVGGGALRTRSRWTRRRATARRPSSRTR
jgi:hypothetical protein